MRIYAKLLEILPAQDGTSQNGNPWIKQAIVVETLADDPTKICVEFLGDRKVEKLKELKVGDLVRVTFVIKSEEYMLKWYTHVNGIDVAAMRQGEPLTPLPPSPEEMAPTGEEPQGN